MRGLSILILKREIKMKPKPAAADMIISRASFPSQPDPVKVCVLRKQIGIVGILYQCLVGQITVSHKS